MNVDVERLFNDNNYKNMLTEYHKFVLFILHDVNRYTIYSCCVKFNKDNILYQERDEFINMLRNTFPTFDVTFETSLDEDDLEEDEYSISVSWKNYIKK
jgi:ABC-type enterochelin transport system ATPase subunit